MDSCQFQGEAGYPGPEPVCVISKFERLNSEDLRYNQVKDPQTGETVHSLNQTLEPVPSGTGSKLILLI